jgi:hypothetical protein
LAIVTRLSFGAGTAAEEGEEGEEEVVMMKEEGEGGGTKMEGFKMVACRATGFVRAVAGGGTITYAGRNPVDSIHRWHQPNMWS